MGRNLSPALRQELANLEKGSGSRKSALEALKSCVKDLDAKVVPLFLAQVSGIKDVGSSSGEYTISMYEVLARAHGPEIVSHINIIMDTIIKTLTSGDGSFPLQQACSKVVPAIARYGIKPTTPEDKKRLIIHSLCKPLSNSLLGTQETLSRGAALCLKALVDCDNWKFASNEMVNEVCQKVAGALMDKTVNMSSHMGLVMSLAKRNSLVVEDYAAILIQSALEILNAGVDEKNSQKRLSAVQMINFLMKCLNIRSILPELELIVEETKKCQSDPMPYVSGAAFEVLQTAKRLMVDKESKFDVDVISESGSNFTRSDKGRGRYHTVSEGGSPDSVLSDSHKLDSFVDYDSFINSSISTCQASSNRNVDSNRKKSGRKLWNHENWSGDISAKGLFPEVGIKSGTSYGLADNGEGSDPMIGYTNVGTSKREWLRSHASSSPQRSNSQINASGIMIYNTPRRLVRSLQNENDESMGLYARQPRSVRSPHSVKCGCSPSKNYHPRSSHLSNGVITVTNNENTEMEGEQSQTEAESVSSTDDVPVEYGVIRTSELVCHGNKIEQKKQVKKKLGFRTAVKLLFFSISFFLTGLFTSMVLFGDEDEVVLVPT